jgi:hypothetical protein
MCDVHQEKVKTAGTQKKNSSAKADDCVKQCEIMANSILGTTFYYNIGTGNNEHNEPSEGAKLSSP